MISLEIIFKCKNVISKKLSSTESLRVSTDTRTYDQEELFICLYGENFNSADHIEKILLNGPKYIIVEEGKISTDSIEKLNSKFNVNFILVKNVFGFLLEVGRIKAEDFKSNGGLIFALTGSNGKTTNKEMIAHLLTALGSNHVFATKGNLNNQIGVPLSLLSLSEEHQVAVIEMGTSLPGEIEILSKVADPNFGYITNIGYAHIEKLKSLEGVFEEKSALFRTLETSNNKPKGFVINAMDDHLKNIPDHQWTARVDKKAFALTENGFTFFYKGKNYNVINKALLGEHQKLNMICSLHLVLLAYPERTEDFISLASNFMPPKMNRGEIIDLPHTRVYLDAYNANPSSMKASLNSYINWLKDNNISLTEVLIILGDMNELGPEAKNLHTGIGQHLSHLGFKRAAFIGQHAAHYSSGFGGGDIFESAAAFKKGELSSLPNSKSVFIKASRSLQLESILDISKH